MVSKSEHLALGNDEPIALVVKSKGIKRADLVTHLHYPVLVIGIGRVYVRLVKRTVRIIVIVDVNTVALDRYSLSLNRDNSLDERLSVGFLLK